MNKSDSLYKGILLAIVIPIMIGSVIIFDKFLVWNGERYAKNLCESPGPLVVYDRALWLEYSNAIKKRIGDGNDQNSSIIKQIRKEYGIYITLSRKKQANPLLVTAEYIQIILWKDYKKVAVLNHYGSNSISPLISIFIPVEAQRKYICKNGDYKQYIEFY